MTRKKRKDMIAMRAAAQRKVWDTVMVLYDYDTPAGRVATQWAFAPAVSLRVPLQHREVWFIRTTKAVNGKWPIWVETYTSKRMTYSRLIHCATRKTAVARNQQRYNTYKEKRDE